MVNADVNISRPPKTKAMIVLFIHHNNTMMHREYQNIISVPIYPSSYLDNYYKHQIAEMITLAGCVFKIRNLIFDQHCNWCLPCCCCLLSPRMLLHPNVPSFSECTLWFAGKLAFPATYCTIIES